MPIVVLFPTSDVCTYLMTQNERENELVVQQQGSVVGPRIHQPQQENALRNAMIMVLMVIIRKHQPPQEYALWKVKKQGYINHSRKMHCGIQTSDHNDSLLLITVC